MRRVPALFSVVPLKHREVRDPEETEIFFRVTRLLKRVVPGCVFLRQVQTQEAALLAKMLAALFHDGGVFRTVRRTCQQPEIIQLNFCEAQDLFRQDRVILRKPLGVGH